MACPSCTFARTFAKRTTFSTAISRRTLHNTSAALEASTASTPAETPLLHITKSKITHPPSNPNSRAPSAPHNTITRRLGIRYSRPVLGSQEWRTSAYHYNKATLKTLPSARLATDKLLSAYAVLQSHGGQPSSRTAIAARRKSSERVYVSRAGVKDFGSKVVVNAYMYDEAGAQQESRRKRASEREARATGGASAGGKSGAARGGGRPRGNAAAVGGNQ